jgi:predicted Zn-dependent protease
VSVLRREVLGTLGIASASSLLWALGCSAPTRAVRRAPQVSDDVRLWLRDAVERLAAVHPTVHALAVSRHRTTTAHDVLGAGIASLRSDGAVLTVRDRDGACREHVTSSLTAEGVAAAATALGATRARKPIDFGPVPARPAEPPALDERDLRRRVDRLLHADAALAHRIVYAAAVLDLDDAIVWSIAPGRDLEQRLVRIRQIATRAAWSGTRPVVRELERAWSGALDDHTLTDAEIAATSEAILEQMTPGTFDDGARSVVLDPSVVAILADTVTRTLLTARARPPAAAPAAEPLASSLFTLIDDPTTAGAYGGFAFDDEGQPAAPLTLVDAGRITARLADLATGASAGAGRGRRPGHLARVAPSSTHLVVLPGNVATSELYDDGFLLEAGLDAALDPATGQLRIACSRARELKAGAATGRIYPDIELVGSLPAVLAAIDAVARDPVTFALRAPRPTLVDPATADPAAARWASVAAPALRTHAFLRARRSRA